MPETTVKIGTVIIQEPVSDFAALKAIDTTEINTGVLVNVVDLGLFKLDKSSTADGDDYNIIEPTTGTGRWIREALADSKVLIQGTDFAVSYTSTNPVASFYRMTYGVQAGDFILPAANGDHNILGRIIYIRNHSSSTYNLAIKASGSASVLATLQPNQIAKVQCISNASAAGSWDVQVFGSISSQDSDNVNITGGTILSETIYSTISNLTGTHTLISSDRGKILQCDGAFVINSDAGSTYGSGFWFIVYNKSSTLTDVIEFAPDGTEKINEMEAIFIYPQQSSVIHWDGTQWHVLNTSGLLGVIQSSSATIDIGPDHFNCTLYIDSTCTVTIDSNANIPLPVGFMCKVFRAGSGGVDFAKDAAVSWVVAEGAVTLRAQGSAATLQKIGANAWTIDGDLVI